MKKKLESIEGEVHFDRQVESIEKWAIENLNVEEIAHIFALHKVAYDQAMQLYKESESESNHAICLLHDARLHLEIGSKAIRDALKLVPEARRAGVNSEMQKATQRGKNAADALHSKPGGSREKQKAIQAAWATGNFSSRDICAEQECAGLQMSFSAARKALRGTPKSA